MAMVLILAVGLAPGHPTQPTGTECAAITRNRRVSCGIHGSIDTPALCAARGCCWDASTTDASSAATMPRAEGRGTAGCAAGEVETPRTGVRVQEWSTVVPLPEGAPISTLAVQISGYWHDGETGGPGPCCGNRFNLSIEQVSQSNFTLVVTRVDNGPKPGWGQQLILGWKLGGPSCPFTPYPTPGPPPPPTPPAATAQCFYAKPAANVTRVIIVDADHLDVGYHGLIADVVNSYFYLFWPRAMAVAAELRERQGPERYTYTTFSWLVSLFFSCPPHAGITCPNATYTEAVRAAITQGDLTWNAFPFNSDVAGHDPGMDGMIAFGVNHTHALDDMLGVKRKTVFPIRDVPGVTRSLIPLALQLGLKAINQAPNGALYPANVPPAFIWKDQGPDGGTQQGADVPGVVNPSGAEMLTLWWQSECHFRCFQQYPLCDTAVFYDWKGEDSGPNVASAADVLALYAAARVAFPDAEVVSGSLDDVAAALSSSQCRAGLPTLTAEVGDSWAYGLQSDPKKVAAMRSATRLRAEYIVNHSASDAIAQSQRPQSSGSIGGPTPLEAGAARATAAPPFDWLSNFSRSLLKGLEHTWGLRYDLCFGGSMGHSPVMSDPTGYPNPAFHKVRADPDGYAQKNCQPSWVDQTNWAVTWANAAVEDSGLRGAIDAELEAIMEPNPVDLAGFTPVPTPTARVTLASGVSLAVCPGTGAICSLRDTAGQEWSNGSIGLFTYSLYTNDQMAAFRDEYCAPHGCNPNEFGKPGMPLNASVTAHPVQVVGVWSQILPGNTRPSTVLIHVAMDVALNRDYGAPSDVWIQIADSPPTSPSSAAGAIALEFILVNKTATRFAEASFITFNPSKGGIAEPAVWTLDKLGEWVSPLDVADGGSKGMHIVRSGVRVSRHGNGTAFFRTVDTPVVKFGDPLPFPTPIHGDPDLSQGARFLLHDNFWTTNFVFWYPYGASDTTNLRYRFAVELQ
eukprot:m.474504 g.474504  ORF g.474504 m.474504 type:complete len:967 (-) comp36357_c0_seq1:352-3252(-)